MPDPSAAAQEHLRTHLTDGHWHDRCTYCINRRRYGGNGVTRPTAPGARS